jgi:hypothetical protein
MTDLTLTLLVSGTAGVVVGLVFALFFVVSNFNDKIFSLQRDIEIRAYDSTVQTLSKTAYATKDRLDAVCTHYNLEIEQEPSKYVVRKK